MKTEAGATRDLLERCLANEPWTDELLERSLAEDGGRAFFSILVERLGDLFEPRLCLVYARLMSRVIHLLDPAREEAPILSRYERVRQPRKCVQDPKTIFVLSRVTLGADVAVTSVILDGLKQRFPHARILLVGSRKNWEMFAADPRIEWLPFSYPRSGTLAERLSAAPQLQANDGIVLDPDSRLSQLGLLPVCEEEKYYFFESRSYGCAERGILSILTAQWMYETFGVSPQPHAYVAPLKADMPADVAVSFGVGENLEKRISDPFERDLLRALTECGFTVMVDRGAGGDESERVDRAVAGLPGVQTWTGDYAPFASMTSQAKLYIGYDSAGQHVAAASGTPLISVFAGYASDRMFSRWHPTGPGPMHVLKVTDRNPGVVLEHTLAGLSQLMNQ